MDCDIVIQGGGVKGIALAGAICALESAGYKGLNFAGTSVGSMIAALLAAGYSADEIKKEIAKIDYKKCLGEDLIDKFGVVGKGMSIFNTFGIYNNTYIERLMITLLARKGKIVFGDLPKFTPNGQSKQMFCNLSVAVTDLTTGRLLVLPDDLPEFGINPATFSIAKAVKASISFPLFYEPVKLKDKDGLVHYLVDGGLISAYPMFILDDGVSKLDRSVFGIRLYDKEPNCDDPKCIHHIKNFIDYLKSIVLTMVEIHDDSYSKEAKGDYERSVFVSSLSDSKKIKTMEFDLNQADIKNLFENGLTAGNDFLLNYSFKEWLEKYRQSKIILQK